MGAEKKKFNTHLSSKSSVIEHAFGLLRLRFPRLLEIKVQTPGQKGYYCSGMLCSTQSVPHGR